MINEDVKWCSDNKLAALTMTNTERRRGPVFVVFFPSINMYELYVSNCEGSCFSVVSKRQTSAICRRFRELVSYKGFQHHQKHRLP